MTLSRRPGSTVALFEPPALIEEPMAVLSLRMGDGRQEAPAYSTDRPGLAACRLPSGQWALARDPRGDVLAVFSGRAAVEEAAHRLGDAADWAGSRKLRQFEEVAVRFTVRELDGSDPRTIPGGDMAQPPIVGAELWQKVMATAGDRCECKGACGKKHLTPARKPGRCEHENEMYVKGHGRLRLLALPRDPSLPWHIAATLPARRLIAFCLPCAKGVSTVINRAVKALPPQDDELFAVEAYTVGRSAGDTT